MTFEEEYEEVLEAIESAVMGVYRRNPALLDYDVADALDALIRLYRAEQIGKPAPTRRFDERPAAVYDAVHRACERILGRAGPEGAGADAPAAMKTISLDEMIACLKRIAKSVDRWNRQNGRRGYLDFVKDFV